MIKEKIKKAIHNFATFPEIWSSWGEEELLIGDRQRWFSMRNNEV